MKYENPIDLTYFNRGIFYKYIYKFVNGENFGDYNISFKNCLKN
jgi:hypothetical protein